MLGGYFPLLFLVSNSKNGKHGKVYRNDGITLDFVQRRSLNISEIFFQMKNILRHKRALSSYKCLLKRCKDLSWKFLLQHPKEDIAVISAFRELNLTPLLNYILSSLCILTRNFSEVWMFLFVHPFKPAEGVLQKISSLLNFWKIIFQNILSHLF